MEWIRLLPLPPKLNYKWLKYIDIFYIKASEYTEGYTLDFRLVFRPVHHLLALSYRQLSLQNRR
ncbi:MAG: hypothetical protein ACI9JM_000295 [Halioglobus sp.]|jgi:hypothetical protein